MEGIYIFPRGGGTPPSPDGSDATANSSGSSFALINLDWVSGEWLIIAVASNQAVTSVSAGTGAAWVELNAGTSGLQVFAKQANGTEPGSYTITLAGTGSYSGIITAVMGASSINPDASTVALNTGTQPSATSSFSTDFALIIATDNETGAASNFTAQPSGYTAITNIADSSNATHTSMAYKASVGTGTISPGTWTAPGTVNSKLWTILFKG